MLLLAVGVAARALPPQTNRQASGDKDKRHGAKVLGALRRVEPDGHGAPWNFQSVNT